ncbi:hypothetical protein ATY76_28100 [Rhizobium sp. R339]|nr:hypothetical protein ATY76_28100 [Rhizobium sp. R339]
MPTELARHLIDRHLAFDKLVQATAIGEGQLQIASGHSKISKGKPLLFSGMSHLEIKSTMSWYNIA